MRLRFIPKASLKAQLALEAQQLRDEAKSWPPGQKRDSVLKKARQHGITSHLAEWLISPGSYDHLNLRNDGYGGSTLVERSRFMVEILKAIRSVVTSGFPVILRLSQWKPKDFNARLAETPKALEQWLGVLVEAGADAFHLSQPKFWQPAFPEVDGELNLAGWAKKLTGVTAITVGAVGLSGDVYESFAGKSAQSRRLDGLLARLERGEFDLVAVGRALLQDPAWLEKVRHGRVDQIADFTPASFAILS